MSAEMQSAENDAPCRHCGEPIREGERSVDWPWIHDDGFYVCALVEPRYGATKAEPRAQEACGTCSDTGRVPWMIEGDPNCYQEPGDEDALPCPDCRVIPPAKTGGAA